MLIFGFKTKIAAYVAEFLLLIFALLMTIVLGIKAPLNYSAWVGSAAAFLLATQKEYFFSIDALTKKL